MARYALIKKGKVENIVEWDGDTTRWSPPGDVIAVQTKTAGAGDGYDGTIFTPPPAPVPTHVYPLQMRKALRKQGLKPRVDAYVSTLVEEKVEAWEYADIIPRSHGLVVEAAAALGMTEAQTDDLFRIAATL